METVMSLVFGMGMFIMGWLIGRPPKKEKELPLVVGVARVLWLEAFRQSLNSTTVCSSPANKVQEAAAMADLVAAEFRTRFGGEEEWPQLD
jgi:hypothetical protein